MKKRLKKKLQKRFEAGDDISTALAPPLNSDECKTLAIEVWRLKRSLKTLPAGVNTGSFGVSVDRLEDLLLAMGVEIHDPSGETYDEGMTLSVSLFEKSKSLPQGLKRIADTISPTIYWKGRMLQPGTVIVEVGDSEE
jgi:hypothetical protein